MYKNGGYAGDDRMCDLVCDRYAVLQVMSRFGIALGFGDKTIAEVCAESRVDAATFLAVVNMLMNFGNGAERRGLGPFADRLSAQLPRLFPGLPASGHPAKTDRGGRLRPKRRFVRHHALFRRVCRRSAAPHVLRGADRFSVCRVAALGREEHGLFDRHLPPPARPD